MKIYFTASILQKKKYGAQYQAIVKVLKKLGHQVRHEHVTKGTLEELELRTGARRGAYYQQLIKWIQEADLVVAEASFPSTLDIGHEISLSLDRAKPVIVLYQQGHESNLLPGMESDQLSLVEYEDGRLAQTLESALDFARDQADTRFNFFISSRQANYLDWVAKSSRIPRSVYLRNLIKRDMEDNLKN